MATTASHNREPSLKNELDELTHKLESVKKQVDELRQDNDWLEEEARKTRVESHEYMTYMTKKTKKRQSAIVTLNDSNQAELNEVRQQRTQMMAEVEKRKEALHAVMAERDIEWDKTNKELDDLKEYKSLQEAQEAAIAQLEKEVDLKRFKHSDAVQKLKSAFLNEKRTFQANADAKVADMQQKANEQATSCLRDHTQAVHEENKELRRELLSLIQEGRVLQDYKRQLEKQNRALLRDRQFVLDLKQIRDKKQLKAIRTAEHGHT
ncbi:coiled-coil domain-containing protein 166-like isoform X3 [Corticium candelabrum]|uniref:coiled-coil domain-containing protein 166-like isoform X3 n=1 Tax=Corticium candelabrum TaxID=121492 RepID=UPI002E30C859|nr:coiled-coil domain-containing protein 166-like isoform X3 [Corticium candelabrum]